MLEQSVTMTGDKHPIILVCFFFSFSNIGTSSNIGTLIYRISNIGTLL